MAAGEERRKWAVRSRVARVRAHLALGAAVEAAVGPAWVAATAFVTWRVLVHRWVPWAGALAALLAVLATLLLARRRVASEAEAAVLTDRLAGAGGLLLTRLERPVGEWELGLNQRLRELALPPLRLRRPAGLLALALLLAGGGLLLPHLEPRTVAPNAAAASRVDQLEDALAALGREVPVEPAVREELERLQAELARGAFDGADWEAADALGARLDARSAEAQAQLARAEQAARALAEAQRDGASAEQLQRRAEALEQALLEAGGAEGGQAGAPEPQGAPGAEGPPPGTAAASPPGTQAPGGAGGGQRQAGAARPGGAGRSQEQVERLERALAERQERLRQGARAGGGHSTPGRPGAEGGSAEAGRRAGAGAGTGAGSATGTGEAHASRGVQPGGAGVGRGGDPADLVFGGQAELDPGRLALEALPDGQGGEAGALQGLRATSPRVRPQPRLPAGGGGAAQGAQAAGYQEGALRPRNRALVERYFEAH